MTISLPTKAVDVNEMTLWGLGTMGRTWAYALLCAGLKVIAHDPKDASAKEAAAWIEATLVKMHGKGKLDEEPGAVMERLVLVDEATAMASGTPWHLEVIPEKLPMKLDFYDRLGKAIPSETVVTSNTSCLDIEKLGRAFGRPEMVGGTHGMNPVHMMPVVETVQTDLTDPTVFAWIEDVMRQIGKSPHWARNVAGFLVNQLFIPFAHLGIGVILRRENEIANVDALLKGSLGHPQGLFKLLDLIGHDIMVDVAQEMYVRTQNPGLVVPPEYLAMVEAGNLGAKCEARRGFYDWADRKNLVAIPVDDLAKMG